MVKKTKAKKPKRKCHACLMLQCIGCGRLGAARNHCKKHCPRQAEIAELSIVKGHE